MTTAPSTPRSIASPGLAADAASFGRHLRASNLSPRTIQSYLEAVDLFGRYIAAQGMPTALASIRREHVEAFIEQLLATYKPATAANRYAGLRAFFRWAVEEGEIRESPMSKMRKPRQPELLPPVLTRQQLEAILDTCRGDTLRDRRDAALVRLFIGTGARLAEVAGLTVADVDLDEGTIVVMGKGRRERKTYIGTKAIKAMDRYARRRREHPAADSAAWWLGTHGPMTASGISQVIKDRGAQAGVPGLHAHAFRHYYAHAMLARGMQEGDLMVSAGWRSREMLARYAAATRADRAIAAARRLNPGDDL
jgi:site-specific recombinase XerD